MTLAIVPIQAHEGPALTPESVEVTLAPGESHEVEKTVHTPAFPPRLDIVLDVDLSGSYFDDLPNIKAKAPGIFDAIRAEVADSQFGLVTFVDYPFNPWGSAPSGDYAYLRNQDLTADKTTWTGAVNAMAVRNGADTPESQYESLYQAATGAGRDVPPAGVSAGDVPPGLSISWRPGTTRVIVITTDAPFHTAGDSNCFFPSPPCPFPYPGPTAADTIAALNAEGIHVIAVKAPGSGGEMDNLAAATGGAVATTGSTSEEIAEAILTALEEIQIEVAMQTDCAAPISVSFAPASQTVQSGTHAVFTETISVDANAAPGTYECDDWATINGSPMTDANGEVIKEHKTIFVPGDEGCTPGYWKNHLDRWEPTGYSPDQTLESVFDVPDDLGLDDATLLEALNFGGGPGAKGGAQILLRAGVAALLNASHPDVAYTMSESDVIDAVNAALATNNRGTMLALAGELDADNNLGCPIDAHGRPLG